MAEQVYVPVDPRNNSDQLPRHYVHYRRNCASRFESLAFHLNENMNIPIPNKSAAMGWIARCIKARENDIARLERLGQLIDKGHRKVLIMLRRLNKFILDHIQPGETAFFSFRNEPQRFLVQTYYGKEVTIYSNEVVNKLEGGRKSTRKNRKTNRKTYRILPRVEGS